MESLCKHLTQYLVKWIALVRMAECVLERGKGKANEGSVNALKREDRGRARNVITHERGHIGGWG